MTGQDRTLPAGVLARPAGSSGARARSLVVLLPFFVVGFVVLAACASPSETADNPGGVVIKGQRDASGFLGARGTFAKPEVTLTDTTGAPFDLATDTTAPVTLVFFGYTNCPDVCSIVLAELAAAMNKLDPEVEADVQVVFITTDPARDTAEAITTYLDTFGFRSWVGLTGSIPTIEEAAVPLQVHFYAEDRLPNGGYEVAHGAHVIGFGTDDTSVLWTQGTPVADLAHDIALLAA